MPLSLKQLQDVCLANATDHRQCRYLGRDDLDPSRHHCLKRSGKKAEIDDELNEYVADLQKKGQDPTKHGIPLGDNCSGYPIMRSLEQGYDK